MSIIPDRKFRCISDFVTIANKGNILILQGEDEILINENFKTNVFIETTSNQKKEILSLVKNPKFFFELPEYIFTISDVALFTLWYKEDTIYPEVSQINDAIEYWLHYQKPKLTQY